MSNPIQIPQADGYLVGHSGGKDSTALMNVLYEYCQLNHKKLEAFCMVMLPGMRYFESIAEYARNRWEVKVQLYTHWATYRWLREGIFRPCADLSVKRVVLADIEARAREDSGLEWIAYGYKSTDSLHRRGMLSGWPGAMCEKRKVFAPLRDYSHAEVLRYLARNRIDVRLLSKGRMSGMSLSPESMRYLRDYWPEDFELVLRTFPRAVAQSSRG